MFDVRTQPTSVRVPRPSQSGGISLFEQILVIILINSCNFLLFSGGRRRQQIWNASMAIFSFCNKPDLERKFLLYKNLYPNWLYYVHIFTKYVLLKLCKTCLIYSTILGKLIIDPLSLINQHRKCKSPTSVDKYIEQTQPFPHHNLDRYTRVFIALFHWTKSSQVEPNLNPNVYSVNRSKITWARTWMCHHCPEFFPLYYFFMKSRSPSYTILTDQIIELINAPIANPLPNGSASF